MDRRYAILDVFTDRALVGNPLAVVEDADGLDDARMQAIAREFNLSETVFIRPPADPAYRASLRIFTPETELPFAGHPTVGTAVFLALQAAEGRLDDSTFALGEKVGPIPCRVETLSASLGWAEFDVAETPRRLGEIGPPGALAAALGIAPDDIGFDGAAPGYFSAGTPFAIVPLRSAEIADRASPLVQHWQAAFGMNERHSAFLIAPTAEADVFHARMFTVGHATYEDPATGSATAAAAALLAGIAPLSDGAHRREIRQGYKMGRPSRIELTLRIANGALAGASIGGKAVLVARGTLHA